MYVNNNNNNIYSFRGGRARAGSGAGRGVASYPGRFRGEKTAWEPLLTHAPHSHKNLGIHICLDTLRIMVNKQLLHVLSV